MCECIDKINDSLLGCGRHIKKNRFGRVRIHLIETATGMELAAQYGVKFCPFCGEKYPPYPEDGALVFRNDGKDMGDWDE